MQYLLIMGPIVAATGLGSAVMGIFWLVFGILQEKVLARLRCSVAINHQDSTFGWVNKFMREGKFLNDDNNLQCKIKSNNDMPWWERIKDDTNEKQEGSKPEVEYNAGPAEHFFTWNGRWLRYTKSEGKKLKSGEDKQLVSNDNIEISAWGSDTTILKQFIDAAVVNSMSKDEGKIGIYEQHRWGIGWNKSQTKKARGIDSVVLDENLSSKLCKDIEWF